jgi:hypothetical protein
MEARRSQAPLRGGGDRIVDFVGKLQNPLHAAESSGIGRHGT